MRNIADARKSGLYEVSQDCELEWVMPMQEHIFAGVEEGFAERPTFVQCLNCEATIKYSQRVWEQFSTLHGEMCRRRV